MDFPQWHAASPGSRPHIRVYTIVDSDAGSQMSFQIMGRDSVYPSWGQGPMSRSVAATVLNVWRWLSHSGLPISLYRTDLSPDGTFRERIRTSVDIDAR